MKNRFKFVSKLDNVIIVNKIMMNSDNNFLDRCEKFIKETMSLGLLCFIYQDKGGIWKQVA